jgi:hypothetical protein
MSPEIKKEIQLEIAHVLFIDIVGYSKRSINEQRAAVDELTQIVRAAEQFARAEAASRLIKIPTGDGMALVFYTSPEAPAQCAVEISRALKGHPSLQLRMGVHSGPVSGVIDVTGRANLAGAGLNIAQRVVSCKAKVVLASAYVALGDEAKAFSTLENDAALPSLAKDALVKTSFPLTIAQIAVQAGKKDLALEQLAISARNPVGVDFGDLKFNPLWDPLRVDPRFEKIVASLEPK